ncbi:MAG: DUF4406 domain-containing protein [Eubacteriales bacterium]
MKFIYVASPYAGDVEKNVTFAKDACEFTRQQGHAFFAPHLFYTQLLDDSVPEQREQGLKMGITALDRSDELWVFGRTISTGMKKEIEYAQKKGIPICHISEQEMGEKLGKELSQKPPPDLDLPPWEMASC